MRLKEPTSPIAVAQPVPVGVMGWLAKYKPHIFITLACVLLSSAVVGITSPPPLGIAVMVGILFGNMLVLVMRELRYRR